MVSRMDRIYRELIDPVEGLDIDPEHGYLSVIVPEATTNLCTNPSFEYGVTTGWGAYNASDFAITYNWQAYGAAGAVITPNPSVKAGASYASVAMAAGTTYTASVTFQGEAGKIYYIEIAAAGPSTLAIRSWVATGLKQRIWVTYTETASNNRWILVTRDAKYADDHPFYIDGLQVETKPYPTTYCDGDQIGFTLDERDYWWNGTPGASSSNRSAQTRAGGREMNLLSYGFRLITILGLGLAALVDQSLLIPGLGALPQGTGTTIRDFTVVGELEGDTPRHLMAQRADLIDVFKPDAVVTPQELILRYQHCDEDGDADSQSVDIVCKYQSGLEGTGAQLQERLALTFRQYVPFIRSTFSSGVQLGYQTNIASAPYILKRASDGTWGTMGSGLAAGAVYTIVSGRDGTVYIGGGFTQAGGVAGTAYLAQWNGTAWSAVGLGTNNDVYALAVDAQRQVYVGGNFDRVAGGGTFANYVAMWDGFSWNILDGVGMNAVVYALAIGPDGSVYAGGNFTTAGGNAANYIARWNGSAWSPLGSGMNAQVRTISIGKDGKVYAAGDFTTAGGVAASHVAVWNGVTWSALGAGVNDDVLCSIIGPDGSLYLGGDFTNSGGTISLSYVARWNGSSWTSLKSGVNYPVSRMTFENDRLYISGVFTYAGDLYTPSGVVIWTGSAWLPIDIQLALNPNVYAILYDPGTETLFTSFSMDTSANSATVTVPDLSGAITYPIIVFTGPGRLYQLKNYTTGKAIYFDYTLLAGETAVLNLDPQNPSFVSSFNGDIWGAILPGSDTDFLLMPGANNISTYLYGGTTAASKIVMYWQGLYWALDEAILK